MNRNLLSIAIPAIAVLLLLVLMSAAVATDLSSPGEITAPGSCRLVADIAGGGIRITVSDVLLNGGGHRVIVDRTRGP